jgi:hypothetical protein
MQNYRVTVLQSNGKIDHTHIETHSVLYAMNIAKKEGFWIPDSTDGGPNPNELIAVVAYEKTELDPYDAMRAIRFAMSLDDHWDRFEFLKEWNEGYLDNWPDYLDPNVDSEGNPKPETVTTETPATM